MWWALPSYWRHSNKDVRPCPCPQTAYGWSTPFCLWAVGPQPSSKMFAKYIGESPNGWAQEPPSALQVPHRPALFSPLVGSIPMAWKPCAREGISVTCQGVTLDRVPPALARFHISWPCLHMDLQWRCRFTTYHSPSCFLYHLFWFISLSNACYKSRKLPCIWKEIMAGYVCVYIGALCICVYMYMCVYVCVYVCIYVCMRVYVHVLCICVCM